METTMNIIGAIVAGLAGTVVISMIMAMAPKMGMPKMAIWEMLGSMFSKDGNNTLGWIIHFSNRKIHPYPPGEVDLAQLRVRSQSGRADETSKRQSPSSKALLPSRAHPMSALSPCFEACLPLVAEAHGLFERALPGDECRLLVPQPQVPREEAETKVFFASRPRVDGAWQ